MKKTSFSLNLNFTFYKYTLIKLFKSVSTYITGAIAIAPSIIIMIISLKDNTSYSLTYSISSFFCFIFYIIFLTFQTLKIFRDEIENKTILTLQSKPINRNGMIIEALLVLFTMSAIISFAGHLLPMSIAGITAGSHQVVVGILVTFTVILLLWTLSSIFLLLSIKMKTGGFLGTILGGVITGFFGLFIIAWLIGLIASSTTHFNIATKGLYPLNENEILIINKGNLNSIFNELQKSQSTSTFAITQWFNPTSHWLRMFNATNNNDINDSILSFVFSSSEKKVDFLLADYDSLGNITEIKFKFHIVETIPIWYPYVIWTIIGAAIIPLCFFSLRRRNIA